MKPEDLLSAEETARAAFELLAAGSMDRYARVAAKWAKRSRLAQSVHRQPETIPALLEAVRRATRALLRSPGRDVPEVYVAVALPIVAQTSLPSAGDLLRELALLDEPSSRWPAALSRRLWKQRVQNVFVGSLPVAERIGALAAVNVRADPVNRPNSAVHVLSRYKNISAAAA